MILFSSMIFELTVANYTFWHKSHNSTMCVEILFYYHFWGDLRFYNHGIIREILFSIIGEHYDHRFLLLHVSSNLKWTMISVHCILINWHIRSERKIHQKLLESVGMKNQGVENGQEAVDIHCHGQRFDLILMDMDMPIMNGIEVLIN